MANKYLILLDEFTKTYPLVKIGNIELRERPLFLAPMEDVTDASFRYICKKFGADMVYTEFIASEALIRDVKKTFEKLEIKENERPIGIQIYGHIIESMVDAAQIVEQDHPDVIDINFGCPVRKIATRGAGAGMLNDIPKLIKMTELIVKAVKTPVTVKTRLGWDENSKVIVDLAKRLQDVGIAALTIHGRTRSQFYKGEADWSLIGEVKNNPSINIPIIGNGDIDSPEKCKTYFDRYGVDGIMIGRATVGKPYIFKEIRHYLDTGEILPPPSVKFLVDLARDHFKKSFEIKGPRVGVFEMRRHFSNYFKGLPNFKELRLSLVTESDYDKILTLLDKIELIYGND